ncbi:MAG: O-antigen ligase family protein [Sedimentisphaerales bacterium]
MLIVLLIVAAIVMAIVIFKYPMTSLVLFITTNVVKAVIMLKFSFFRVVDYTVLCAVITLIAMAYSFMRSGGRLRDIINIPLGLYLLLATILLLATTYTSAPNTGWVKSSRFATLGLIAFFSPIVFTHSVKEIKQLIWLLFFVGIALAVTMVAVPYQSMLNISTERGAFLEASPGATANLMAITPVIAFVFAIMARTSPVLRAVSLGSIFFVVVMMITTGGRGPFVGLILIFLAAIFICRKGISKAWFPAIISAILIIGAVSLIKLPEEVTWRITGMFKGSYELQEAASARTERFVWTATRSFEHPILGHGTGAFVVDRGGEDIGGDYPHNMILELMYEEGLVGVVVGCLFLWFIFRRWRQALKYVNSYGLGIEALQFVHTAGLLFLYALIQAMKSGDLDGNRFMFFCAGFVVAVFNLLRRTIEETSLESELTAEDEQDLEGVEFQDIRVLY